MRWRLMLPIAVGLTGCITTTSISSPGTSPLTPHINQEGARRKSTVVGRQQRYRATWFEIDTTRISLHTSSLGHAEIPLSDLRTIEFRDASRGMTDGFLIGLGVAAAAGMIVIASAPDYSGLGYGLQASAVVGKVTIPLGALYGLIIAHKTRYEVSPPPP